jgi:hypothetical protein
MPDILYRFQQAEIARDGTDYFLFYGPPRSSEHVDGLFRDFRIELGKLAMADGAPLDKPVRIEHTVVTRLQGNGLRIENFYRHGHSLLTAEEATQLLATARTYEKVGVTGFEPATLSLEG